MPQTRRQRGLRATELEKRPNWSLQNVQTPDAAWKGRARISRLYLLILDDAVARLPPAPTIGSPFQGDLEIGHIQGAFGPYLECAGRARDGGPARRRRFDSARPKALWMRFSTSPSDPKRRRASLAAAVQKAASRLRTAFVESRRECFNEGRIWQCWSGTLAHDRDLAGTAVAHLRPDPTLKCPNSRPGLERPGSGVWTYSRRFRALYGVRRQSEGRRSRAATAL
jgi:hypothetical protein